MNTKDGFKLDAEGNIRYVGQLPQNQISLPDFYRACKGLLEEYTEELKLITDCRVDLPFTEGDFILNGVHSAVQSIIEKAGKPRLISDYIVDLPLGMSITDQALAKLGEGTVTIDGKMFATSIFGIASQEEGL